MHSLYKHEESKGSRECCRRDGRRGFCILSIDKKKVKVRVNVAEEMAEEAFAFSL
jgi:hypothetical protein